MLCVCGNKRAWRKPHPLRPGVKAWGSKALCMTLVMHRLCTSMTLGTTKDWSDTPELGRAEPCRGAFIGSASAADLLDSRIPGFPGNRGRLPGAPSLEASRIDARPGGLPGLTWLALAGRVSHPCPSLAAGKGKSESPILDQGVP